ncbi:unnamed protein product, partial [marine sediment metagenome]
VLAPEIVPVIIVEDERVENLHLQREHRFGCNITLAGIVNEYFYFQLNNGADRNGLIVIEEVGICDTSGAFGPCDWGYSDPAVTASLAARDMYCLDSRIPGRNPNRSVADALIGTDLGAGLIDVFGRSSSIVNDTTIIHPNLVVTPGYGFSIWNVTVNHPMAGWCFWRERQAEDGELIGP